MTISKGRGQAGSLLCDGKCSSRAKLCRGKSTLCSYNKYRI